MLSCYRVLDLTDDKAFICGRALSDFGAEVIKIEKPGGDPARMKGSFTATRQTRRKTSPGSPSTPIKRASRWISPPLRARSCS